MYLVGSCSSFFHLARTHPVAVLAVGLSMFGTYVVASNPTVGDMNWTKKIADRTEQRIIAQHPDLAQRTVELQAKFQTLDVGSLTEAQAEQVLRITDACTDKNVQEIIGTPEGRHDVAWLLYLDTFSREGPAAADRLFKKPGSE